MAANPLQFPNKTLTIDIASVDGVTTVKCSGRLVADTIEVLRPEVKKRIPENKRLNLDLAEVNYMDSSALGTLVGLYVSAKAAGCDLKLINLTDRIRDLLRMTKLSTIFEGYGEYL
jgi:anti-sigma B factor antagonist